MMEYMELLRSESFRKRRGVLYRTMHCDSSYYYSSLLHGVVASEFALVLATRRVEAGVQVCVRGGKQNKGVSWVEADVYICARGGTQNWGISVSRLPH